MAPACTGIPLPPFSVRIDAGRGKSSWSFPATGCATIHSPGWNLEREADYLAAVPLRLTVEGR